MGRTHSSRADSSARRGVNRSFSRGDKSPALRTVRPLERARRMKRTNPAIRPQGNPECATQGEPGSSDHQRLRVQCRDGHLEPAPKRESCSRV